MTGSSTSRGRPREVEDEVILNVIRRSDNKEVPKPDIDDANEITIGAEAVRNRLNQLESDNRVESRTVGQMRMFQLGELESEEPVMRPKMAKAHRWSNFFRSLGGTYFYVAVGLLFGSISFFILFLHGATGDVNPPLLTQYQVLIAGYGLGYLGALAGFASGVSYGAGIFIPKATSWWVSRSNKNGHE